MEARSSVILKEGQLTKRGKHFGGWISVSYLEVPELTSTIPKVVDAILYSSEHRTGLL